MKIPTTDKITAIIIVVEFDFDELISEVDFEFFFVETEDGEDEIELKVEFDFLVNIVDFVDKRVVGEQLIFV